MNFHVANRGVAIDFDFPAGGGGCPCLNFSNKIKKKNSSLSSLTCLLLINLLNLVRHHAVTKDYSQKAKAF